MNYLNCLDVYNIPIVSLVHPCELHCRPTSDYFSEKLLDTVTDGTPCFMNNNSRSICVNGVCKVVWLGKRLMKSRVVGSDEDYSRLQLLSSLLICPVLKDGLHKLIRLMLCNLLVPKCWLCGGRGAFRFCAPITYFGMILLKTEFQLLNFITLGGFKLFPRRLESTLSASNCWPRVYYFRSSLYVCGFLAILHHVSLLFLERSSLE